MPWLALTLEVDAAHADALSDALVEAGASSVALDEPQGSTCRLVAIAPLEADAAALVENAARAAGLPAAPAFDAGRLEDEDWVRRTQAQFAPMQIGTRLWVGPSWHAAPAGVAAAVRLDPGLAFGTGSHATTSLVLGYLERHVHGGERLLDYGCGSGILAIAAAKLGASRVDATDIDPVSVATAAENAVLNDVTVHTGAPDELEATLYDFVVSNILAQPLIVLAPLLASRAARGAHIVLSGILESQAMDVAAAYVPFCDMKVAEAREGWALLAGRRR